MNMDMIEKHEVVTYAVSLIAAKRGPAATIHACDSAGTTHIYLRFYRAGYARPDNTRIEAEDGSLMYLVSYRYEQLAAAVDLLRYEKPMFFVFNQKSRVGSLATDEEPTGEGPEFASEPEGSNG